MAANVLNLEVQTSEPKYELTDDIQFLDTGVQVFGIRALHSFGTVKKGDLGGYIESEDNLSH